MPPAGSGFAKLTHSGTNYAPTCDANDAQMDSCPEVTVMSADAVGNLRRFWINFTTNGINVDEIALTLHFSSAPVTIEVYMI